MAETCTCICKCRRREGNEFAMCDRCLMAWIAESDLFTGTPHKYRHSSPDAESEPADAT